MARITRSLTSNKLWPAFVFGLAAAACLVISALFFSVSWGTVPALIFLVLGVLLGFLALPF